MSRQPASVSRHILNLVTVLGVSLFVWNVGAPDSWKDKVHAWGDDFVAAGEAADDLQRTSWRHNLGLAGPKSSDRDHWSADQCRVHADKLTRVRCVMKLENADLARKLAAIKRERGEQP